MDLLDLFEAKLRHVGSTFGYRAPENRHRTSEHTSLIPRPYMYNVYDVYININISGEIETYRSMQNLSVENSFSNFATETLPSSDSIPEVSQRMRVNVTVCGPIRFTRI